MKKLFVLSSELFAFIILGFLIGRFLDRSFLLEGWATLACLFLAYILWFLSFYKTFR